MRFVIILTIAFLSLLASTSFAQGGRAGTWELGFNLSDMSSERFEGANQSGLSVSDEIGWGFQGGYNFTDRFALFGDVNYSSPSYTATFVPDGAGSPVSIGASLDVTTVQARGVFYFLTGNLSPFIEAGVGWTQIDSNIIEGPGFTGCWWDPWWGYVCDTFYDTYTETRTSFSSSVGVRWEMSREIVLRGSVGLFEIDTNRTTEDAEFDTLQIGFAWRF